eukprot:Phypoly_transcript_16331.p2 GENE.Phypoly_transcript_16331~~Phypoly_transcript_16331.p2  ORF type:complete len:128 (+),score=15.02 Phypoly_transcript_16331:105-488(+)
MVRVEANERTDMGEVKRMAREMLKGSGVCGEGVKYLQRRVRVVMTRNANIKEMLVNHRKVIEGFEDKKPKCVCGGKRKHVAKRGSEWVCGRDEVFQVHCKLVPKPNKEATQLIQWATLYQRRRTWRK